MSHLNHCLLIDNLIVDDGLTRVMHFGHITNKRDVLHPHCPPAFDNLCVNCDNFDDPQTHCPKLEFSPV